MPGKNEQTLRDIGLITGQQFTGDYSKFIEGLSKHDMEVLVRLKRRLDKAGIPTTELKVNGPIL